LQELAPRDYSPSRDYSPYGCAMPKMLTFAVLFIASALATVAA
jgi:hypothetical protein